MTRSVAHGLYPVALEHGGLSKALEQLADQTRSLRKMDCSLHIGFEVQVHDPLVAINLYRIAQEAITNALKYSQAGHMQIRLDRVDGKGQLTLTDDGIGIASSRLRSAKGLGMHSMQYRASLLGGSMQINSTLSRAQPLP
jgi:signal transduction histidine kinase